MAEGMSPEDHALLRKINSGALYREAIEALLSGNDTGCFTTQQFEDAYTRLEQKYGIRFPDPSDHQWAKGVARSRLLTFPELVREVQPDVWASVNILG